MGRVLVTGGAGFIGSFLVERLLSLGEDVVVVDNLSHSRVENLNTVRHKIEFRNDNCARRGWRAHDVDPVYHLAGLASVRSFVNRPIAAFWASVAPVRNLFAQQRESGIKWLFTSSSEVYGEPQRVPTDEDSMGYVSITGPRSGYDEGKRAAEALIAAHRREGKGQAVVLRLFNTYGPRMTADGRMVSSMVRDALVKGCVTVNRPGTQYRTLLYVTDCVDALITAMECQPSEPINIGGMETYTVSEVAALIRSAIGDHVLIESGPAIEDEPMCRKPDISRAARLLGWRPKVGFQEGLRATIEYWRLRELGEDPVSGRQSDHGLTRPAGAGLAVLSGSKSDARGISDLSGDPRGSRVDE